MIEDYRPDAISGDAAALCRVVAEVVARSVWPGVPDRLRARVLAELERSSARLVNVALVLGRYRPRRGTDR